MDLKNIKKVEHDDIKTSYNPKAVCPYCGYENEMMDSELYGEQDEELELDCGNCSKTFIYTTNYEVTFSTTPYENWALNKINRHIEKIEKYSKEIDEAETVDYKDYLKTVLSLEKNQLKNLKEDIKQVLGV